jgi:2-oxoglutarate ferredoxin oxidoreductase subunit beta
VHDEADQCLAFLLSQLTHPEFPEPLGVIYNGESRDPYEQVVIDQVREAIKEKGPGNLQALLDEGETWEIDDD